MAELLQEAVPEALAAQVVWVVQALVVLVSAVWEVPVWEASVVLARVWEVWVVQVLVVLAVQAQVWEA